MSAQKNHPLSSSEQLHPMALESKMELLIGLASDLRDTLSRIIRVESHVVNISQKVDCHIAVVENQAVQSAVISRQLREQISALETQVQALIIASPHKNTSSNDSSLSVTDYCAFDSCKELLAHSNRPCSAAVSLRHMLDCPGCPQHVCRVSFILQHMSSFVRAPQVCHVDTCCYCGQSMIALSPDARCSHRKACIVNAKEMCNDPNTHDATVIKLLNLWNQPDIGSPTKRSRVDPISPILKSGSQSGSRMPGCDSGSANAAVAHWCNTPPSGFAEFAAAFDTELESWD